MTPLEQTLNINKRIELLDKSASFNFFFTRLREKFFFEEFYDEDDDGHCCSDDSLSQPCYSENEFLKAQDLAYKAARQEVINNLLNNITFYDSYITL